MMYRTKQDWPKNVEASVGAQHRETPEAFLVLFVKALARESAREYDKKEQKKNINSAAHSGIP
tara:strand:+ start:1269 stop:1457 length:189 start_codon:yes stop_codon:yes gene_type:complete